MNLLTRENDDEILEKIVGGVIMNEIMVHIIFKLFNLFLECLFWISMEQYRYLDDKRFVKKSIRKEK